VLIIWESSVGAFLLSVLLQLYHCYYTLHIIYFSTLAKYHHKCTHSCYFPCYSNLLLKRWRWCGILRWDILDLCCPGCIFLWIMEPSTILLPWESFSLLKDNMSVISILLFVTFGIIMNTFIRMSEINVPRHTCDEYLILFQKLGMIAISVGPWLSDP
jgi:hypothetical protein